MIQHYRKMTAMLARHQKHSLSLLDHIATGYQYLINLIAYYPGKTTGQIGMFTYLQIVDSLRVTGKIRIVKSVIEKKNHHYKTMVDRHSPT